MKIIFLTTGDVIVPSSRTRVFQYLPYLKAESIQYRVLIANKQKYYGGKYIFIISGTLYHAFIVLKFLFYCFFYEVIFVQKVLLPKPLIKIFKLLKKKIVFDFDDAIYSIQDTITDPAVLKRSQINNNRFNNIIFLSDLVILENDYNKEYVGKFNKKIIMITGPIDTERYLPSSRQRNSKRVVIGWIGSPTNMNYLKLIFPVLDKISQKYPEVFFKFIGAAPVNLSCDRFLQVDWNIKTEVTELQEFDIGIMPLVDEEWSRGKGAYKLLQYMSIGIPSVASLVGINSELIKNDINGYLCSTDKEWYDKLCFLIENPELRKLMGQKAREIVEEKYSLRVAAPLLLSALGKL